jgi:hypothetical protein
VLHPHVAAYMGLSVVGCWLTLLCHALQTPQCRCCNLQQESCY